MSNPTYCTSRTKQQTPVTSHGLESRQLFIDCYDELRRLAHSKLRQAGGLSQLNTTGLTHESYMKFVSANGVTFADEHHFMGYAAKVMRSIIIDAVRARQAARSSGGVPHIDLDTRMQESLAAGQDEEILRVHDALSDLSKVDERLCRVVELRYFAGLSDIEIGAMLGLTTRTIQRDWKKAKIILSLSLQCS